MFDGRFFERLASLLMESSVILAAVMATVVVLSRSLVAITEAVQRYLRRIYGPLVDDAIRGDAAAERELIASPARYRLPIAHLLVEPLIDDRDPDRIARTRAIVEAMSLMALADRYLHSRLWWRRALSLRALGLLQSTNHTGAIVRALDDPHADVRAAALDALTDLQDPASIPAVVVRLHDGSLHRGRRAAALAAFGPAAEGFLVDMAESDVENRVNFARALSICGTERARPLLMQWVSDKSADVRAAAFEALAHVGLDRQTARLAVEALESGDLRERVMAASALAGWTGDGEAAVRLASHLDDAWPVAVKAARSLKSMGEPGLIALQAYGSRPDLAGELARQMLWQAEAQC